MVEAEPLNPPDPDEGMDARDLLMQFARPVGIGMERLDIEDVADRVFPAPVVFDPLAWADKHGIFLWSEQRALLQNVVENPYTATRACHEVGKSFAICVLILAWVDTYGYDAFVLWAAPSHPQVDAVIGRELRSLVRMLDLPDIVVMESNEIKYRGKQVGYGRAPSPSNEQPFSGLHARRPLVILDEGGALNKVLFDSANTVVGNENGRLCTIGNPDNPLFHFKQLFEPGSKYKQQKISAFRSPNFTEEATRSTPNVRAYMEAEGIPFSTEVVPAFVSDVLLHPSTAEAWIEEFGINSAYVTSKLKAEFPESSDDAVYKFDVIGNAQADLDPTSPPRCLTVDIGAGGTDATVAYSIRANGDAVLEFVEPKSDLMPLADRIHVWAKAHPDAFVVVDANGLGEGVFSRLRQLGVRVRGFYGQQTARDSKTYANARAEAAFDTARAMQNGALRFSRYDDVLRGELPNVMSKLDGKMRYLLMSKEELAKRGIASPNHADALSMGVWELRIGVVRSRRVGLVAGNISVGGAGGYAT